MSSRPALDVSSLPPSAVDTRSLLWWGNVWMLVIEGSVFALLAVTYFYLRFYLPVWPPPGTPQPLLWPSVGLAVLLASAWPMHRADKAAERGERRGVQVGLLLGVALAAVFLVVRFAVWGHLGYKYSSHAYGSIVWAILLTHTFHVITATLEAAVLAGLAFTDRFHDEQRLGVVTSGLYWNFVVGSWVALYLIVYVAPRVL